MSAFAPFLFVESAVGEESDRPCDEFIISIVPPRLRFITLQESRAVSQREYLPFYPIIVHRLVLLALRL